MIILDTAYTMIAVKIWSLSQSRVELDETKMATQKVSFFWFELELVCMVFFFFYFEFKNSFFF